MSKTSITTQQPIETTPLKPLPDLVKSEEEIKREERRIERQHNAQSKKTLDRMNLEAAKDFRNALIMATVNEIRNEIINAINEKADWMAETMEKKYDAPLCGDLCAVWIATRLETIGTHAISEYFAACAAAAKPADSQANIARAAGIAPQNCLTRFPELPTLAPKIKKAFENQERITFNLGGFDFEYDGHRKTDKDDSTPGASSAED